MKLWTSGGAAGPGAVSRATRNHDRHDGLMNRILTATEVKATILALLDDVAAGDEVEITKHGRVGARLVPSRDPHRIRGALAGTARSTAGDDELFTTGAS